MEAGFKTHFARLVRSYRFGAVSLAICTLLTGMPVTAQDRLTSREALVKAAMVYNFIRFIEWPGQEVASRIVCTYKGSSLTLAMRSIVGKPVGSAKVAVRELQNADDLAACDVFVTTESDAYEYRPLSDVSKLGSILTVSDKPGFARRGGIIEFTNSDGKVGFQVNIGQANKRGLKFSSRLLRLAEIVSTEVGQ